MDIAKEKHNAFFGTATGMTLHRGMFFDNTLEGFRKLHMQVEALKTQYGLPKVVFGMEPTANYHKPLAEHLIKCGHRVVLVSPSSTVKNRELLDGRWDKHDTKDAANVADLIAQGKCLFYDYPDAAIPSGVFCRSRSGSRNRSRHCRSASAISCSRSISRRWTVISRKQ